MKLTQKLALIVLFTTSVTVFSGLILLHIIDLFPINNQVLAIASKLLTLALVIILATFILWKVILKITLDRVVSFNQITKIITTGNLGVRVQVHGNDELTELAQNINAMVRNMAVAFQNMANSLSSEMGKSRELSNTLAQIEREKARIEALLVSINDGVIGVDSEGKIMLFNLAKIPFKCVRLSGVSSEVP